MRALYEKTIVFILQYIDEQGLQPGAKLPAEAQLAVAAGVSLITVRRALAELAARSVVRREQGRGTFLLAPRTAADTTRFGGLRHSLQPDTHATLSTRLLGCVARAATDEERTALELAPHATVWDVSRLRQLRGRPVIVERSAIPAQLAPDLGRYLDAHDPRSLYDLLDAVYHLREVREEQVFVARAATPREESVLNLLAFEWVAEITGTSYATRPAPRAGQVAIDRFHMVFVASAFAFRFSTAPEHAVEAVELTAES